MRRRISIRGETRDAEDTSRNAMLFYAPKDP